MDGASHARKPWREEEEDEGEKRSEGHGDRSKRPEKTRETDQIGREEGRGRVGIRVSDLLRWESDRICSDLLANEEKKMWASFSLKSFKICVI
jgi:hypothetical protein